MGIFVVEKPLGRACAYRSQRAAWPRAELPGQQPLGEGGATKVVSEIMSQSDT